MAVERYAGLKVLANFLDENTISVVGLGNIKKEWYSFRKSDSCIYFGALGGTVALAAGVAIALPHRRVVVITTDGDLFMELGQLPPVAEQELKNMVIVVFDNEAYEVIGSSAEGPRPTHSAFKADLSIIARGCGFDHVYLIDSLKNLEERINNLGEGPNLLVVKTSLGKSTTPMLPVDGIESKYRFVRFIERTEGIKVIAELE